MSVFTLVYPSRNVCTCRVEDDCFRYKLPFYNILEDGLRLKLAVLHLMVPLCKALPGSSTMMAATLTVARQLRFVVEDLVFAPEAHEASGLVLADENLKPTTISQQTTND